METIVTDRTTIPQGGIYGPSKAVAQLVVSFLLSNLGKAGTISLKVALAAEYTAVARARVLSRTFGKCKLSSQ